MSATATRAMGSHQSHRMGTDVCRALLGVDWTTKHELSQVVPPIFTEYLGYQLRAYLITHRDQHLGGNDQ